MNTPQERAAGEELAEIRQHIREAKDAAEDADIHGDEHAPPESPYHGGVAEVPDD